ncbi:MAG: hypothetical protein HY579_09465 [Nitrospinae bacterium]|nr:hypothetical protein [Nitrospinota bacterium]
MPGEIARRESLRSRLDDACRRLEARAKARAESERERHEKIVQAREERNGRKKGGKPKAPDPSPGPREQSNLTGSSF